MKRTVFIAALSLADQPRSAWADPPRPGARDNLRLSSEQRISMIAPRALFCGIEA